MPWLMLGWVACFLGVWLASGSGNGNVFECVRRCEDTVYDMYRKIIVRIIET